MDFFAAQDLARRNTHRLVALFALAVLVLIALANAAVAFGLWLMDERIFGAWQYTVEAPGLDGAQPPLGPLAYVNLPLILGIGAVIAAGVLLASLFKHLQLRRGGRKIAEMLGGRLLVPDSGAGEERRLLNVVEEIAIASGVPVPRVYIVPGDGINAFAAGYAAEDAVIGVTEGALARLRRDELQGVIAHEFSHLLNGDMRLNLRLIALLYGILFIAQAGRVLLDANSGSSRSSRSRDLNAIVLVGLALLAIGWAGVLCGRLIKAGVSREREFLADASSVQFTRNPLGLADALRKIGGLGEHGNVASARAEEASHLFFAQAIAVRVGSLFATHPPLAERIRRIDPAWRGEFPREAEIVAPLEDDAEPAMRFAGSSAAAQPAQTRDASGASAEFPIPGVAAEIRAACRDAATAPAVVLGCLIDANAEIAERQHELLARHGLQPPAGLSALLAAAPLPQVLELAMPALRTLEQAAQERLLQVLEQSIALDNHLDMRELLAAALLERHLRPPARPAQATRARYSKLEQVAAPLTVLFSALAQATAGDTARQFAAAQAASGMSGLRLLVQPPPDWAAVRAALAQLRGLFPLRKPPVLKGCRAALQSGTAPIDQRDALLAMLAIALDCPLEPASAPDA